MVSPEQKVIISIESTKNELKSFIKSLEAAIDSLIIKECFPHVQNLSKLIDELNKSSDNKLK